MNTIQATEDIEMRASIFKHYAWPYAKIKADSSTDLGRDSTHHWRRMLGLFMPYDIIWVGNVDDTGKPVNAANFRTAREWLMATEVPGPFICSSTFKPGSTSRRNDNIGCQRFLVVGSGNLDRDKTCAVYLWLNNFLELDLRAIVDDGNGALQAWFVHPGTEGEEELKKKLVELNIRLRLFLPSQPCCLPIGEHHRLILVEKHSNRSKKAHKQINVSVRGKIISIDEGVRTLVMLLNNIPQLETIASCQGDSADPYAYVYFGGAGAFLLLAALIQELRKEENSWKREHRHVCRGCSSMSVRLEVLQDGIALRWEPRDYYRVLRIVRALQNNH